MTDDNYYEVQGWTIIEYDDQLEEIIDKISDMLEAHSLDIEYCKDECDGFQPIRIISKTS